MDIPLVLDVMYPGAEWTGSAETYDDLNWTDVRWPKPTLAEITEVWNGPEVAAILNAAAQPPVSADNNFLQIQHIPIPTMTGTSTISKKKGITPSSNEGTEILSLEMTPHLDTSLIEISFSLTASVSRSSEVIIVLFRDGVCISASSAHIRTRQLTSLPIKVVDEPNTVGPVVYTVRMGNTNSSSWFLNRDYSDTMNGVYGNQEAVFREFI